MIPTSITFGTPRKEIGRRQTRQIPRGRHGQNPLAIDPGINGRLDHRDDDPKTKITKYTQPQARLFALITDGILNQKLPWKFVVLGAMIAVVLELCGVSSLAFAVGMYLWLSSSTPIFLGGFVRYLVDRVGRKKSAQPVSDLEAEMSPGMLFSTGYIAGGSIAGVLISFLAFSDELTKSLKR